jgi:hypothetical protein
MSYKSFSVAQSDNTKSPSRYILKLVDSILYDIWFKIWFQSLDNSLSYLVPTTFEIFANGNSKTFYIYNAFNFLLWMLLTVVTTPIGLVFYFIWFILFRILLRTRPFEIQVRDELPNENETHPADQNKVFEVLSINVCLLPETLSKINNLYSVHTRLESIGNILNKTQAAKCCHLSSSEKCLTKYSPNKGSADQFQEINSTVSRDGNSHHNSLHGKFNVNVVDDMLKDSDADFVCLQEVWSIETSNKIRSLIGVKYKYVVYDIGLSTFRLNRHIGFDSGLLFASKYPIMNADFKQFNTKAGTCVMTGKGLLMVKMLLGQENGKTRVGFVSNTHLQAYQSKIIRLTFVI